MSNIVKHRMDERYCHCIVNRICVWVPDSLKSKIFAPPSSLILEGFEHIENGMYANYIVSENDLLNYDVQAFLSMLLSEGFSYDIVKTFKSCSISNFCFDDVLLTADTKSETLVM